MPGLLPLAGLRIVEFEGIGPGPLAGRMLADHGAEVVAVVRPNKATLGNPEGRRDEDPLRRGKRAVTIDLKQPQGVEEALALIEGADALIEGNRPGVMERLGLGPSDCAKRNPKLVYGRMTGWGQDGPLSQAAGHDLNYIALTGALGLTQRPGAAPIAPPTVLGDAGGALGLAFGIVSAVFAASRTGKGAVIDCSILDMTAALSGIALWARARGMADGSRPSIFHDSPFYDFYLCADGRYVTIGSLEPQFYALAPRKARPDRRRPASTIRHDPMAGVEGAAAVAVRESSERRLARDARRNRCLLRAGAQLRRSGRASPSGFARDL